MNIKNITSKNNPLIKEVAKLSEKKHREEKKQFAFEGRKLLQEALKSNAPLEHVFVTEDALKHVENYNIPCGLTLVTEDIYHKISFEKSPEGIFCVSKALDKFHNIYIIYRREDFVGGRIFLLDGIRDPGNLGTILRTASAFGCETVILSEDCADVYNSKTVRASMGAVFRQRTVRVRDMAATVKELKAMGKTVYCAALESSSISIFDVTPSDDVCFVVGNEANGIRREVIDASSGTVIIPMEKDTESLNAASASTILLYEQYKLTK